MAIRGDTLLASTGVFPAGISAEEHAAASTVADTFARRLKTWSGKAEPKPFEYKEPPNLDRIFAKLAEDPMQSDVEAWVNGIGVHDPDLVGDYYPSLMRARQYLIDAWPKFAIDGPTGPKVLPLSHDDTAEMWSLIQVVDDPEKILDEMDMWTLSPSQAKAFVTCYPDLYAAADASIRDALTSRLARDASFDIGWEREAVLNVFEGKPPEGKLDSPPPAPEAPAKMKLDPEREKTQSQVSGSAKGSK